MSAWEPPRPASGRTRVAAAIVATVAVAAAVAAAITEPSERIVVDTDPQTEQRTEAEVGWSRPRPGLWRLLPAAPLTPRIAHAMTWIDDRVFVWGGFDASGRPLADGALFEPSTGAWRRLPPSTATNTAAYARATPEAVIVVSSTATYRYDPLADAWTGEARLPRPAGHVIDQVVSLGEAVAVLTRPAAGDVPAPPAIFVLWPGAPEWRRLPDPPVRYADGDLLVGGSGRLLVITRQPARAVVLDATDGDAAWVREEPPPEPAGGPARRLVGAAAADGQTVVMGLGAPRSLAYAAVHDGTQWRSMTAVPLLGAGAVDALSTDDGVLFWARARAAGAMYHLSTRRWITLPALPGLSSVPQPAVWTGSSLVTWGGFVGGGGMYRPR